MAPPSTDRTAEWEGGSLGELMSALQASALPVRIEVIAPGAMGSGAGEVHLLAGGLSDAFAGSLRRDDAVAALQRLEGARFLVESRLPDPDTGSLSEPGPHKGNLKDRPLASLMRYCEEYVLTCRMEIGRGHERAVISYRRGEITGTTVGGSDGEERLPEVLSWSDGSYEIILPAPVLPPAPARKRDAQSSGRIGDAMAKPERKRHATLPMTPVLSTPPPPPLSRPAAGAPQLTVPFQPVGPAPAIRAPAAPLPPSPARPSAPPPPTPRLPPPPPAVATAAPSRQPPPAPTGPAPEVPAGPFPPESTRRGIPAIPPAPLVPPPAARPTTQGSLTAAMAPRPPAPAATKPVPQTTPAATPTLQRHAAPPPLATPAATPAAPRSAVPPTAAAPAATRSAPPPTAAAPAATKSAPPPTAAAPAATKSAPPQAPAAPATSRPTTTPAPAVAPLRPTTPVLAPAVAPRRRPTPVPMPPSPPAVPASARPAEGQPAPPPRTVKPSAVPPASNDLRSASGTIEARPKRASPIRPAAAPIEVAEEPAPPPSTPAPLPSQPSRQRRPRISARKRSAERPVRVYVLMGLAIGIGIVLAYWLYWSLPFGHR